MGAAHDRILKIELTADESDDTVEVTAVTYYRNRDKYDADDGESIEHTADDAAGTHETEFGQLLPPPTHIVLDSTFQA